MRLLYIGDIMGEPGMRVVEHVLPGLRKLQSIDVVIAQAENVTNGKGVSKQDFERLRGLGVDFCTGGNWSMHDSSILPYLSDPQQPIIRPANYPGGTPGLGSKCLDTPRGKILVISLLGQIVGRDADAPMDNPLHVIDRILEAERGERLATIVNFHGDYSSEKRVIGYYLDGRVTMVVGDHWHVPTADAMILPKGTAHISDVGMCGALDSSLGVKLDVIIDRWHSGTPSRNVLETQGRMQFNALCVDVGAHGHATRIEHIQMVDD